MSLRTLPPLLLTLLLTFLLASCQQAGTPTRNAGIPSAPSSIGSDAQGVNRPAGTSTSNVVGPTALSVHGSDAQSVERPNKGHFVFQIDRVQYAPPGTRSTFGGRCSVPSLFIEFGKGTGEMTHGGRVDVTFSHCTRTTAGHEITFRDGAMTIVTANGDALTISYGIGTVSPIDGSVLIDTPFTATGGTGRFEGASGGGTMHGEAAGTAQEVLDGLPFDAEMTGTITYAPGRGAS